MIGPPDLDLDPSALAEIDQGRLYEPVLSQSRARVALLGFVPAEHAILFDGALTEAGAALLVQSGVTTVIDGTRDADQGGLLATPDGNLAVVPLDADRTAELREDEFSAVRAHRLLAELSLRGALAVDEQPSPVLLGGPDSGGLSPIALDVLLNGFDPTGFLEAVGLNEDLGLGGSVRPDERSTQDLRPLADQVATVLDELATYRGFYISGGTDPDSLRGQAVAALGRELDPASRSAALTQIRAELDAAFSVVSLPDFQAVTLAAQQSVIPLAIHNDASGGRNVMLRFESDKVEVPADGTVLAVGPGAFVARHRRHCAFGRALPHGRGDPHTRWSSRAGPDQVPGPIHRCPRTRASPFGSSVGHAWGLVDQIHPQSTSFEARGRRFMTIDDPLQQRAKPGYLVGNRYELISPVASGGMAQVWQAVDRILNRRVAVKILHPHLAGDRGFLLRFRREAVAAARLSHPSVVSIYDTVSADGLEAIVMEFIEGRTLREVLDTAGPFSPLDARDLGLQVAEALDAAHRGGVVHRDIKPSNIMLCADRRVMVTDFGIAKAGEDTDLTVTGTLLGTAKYLSPEQVRGDAADARSDLYALGVVLYEALAGRAPFKGETDAATALIRLHEDPPPLAGFRADAGEALTSVIHRLLQRDPADRFQRALDVRAALSGLSDPTKVDATTLVDHRPDGHRPA